MVTVGYIEGGQAANVIPETVKFGGTFRSLTNEGLLYIEKRIREVNPAHPLLPYQYSIDSTIDQKYFYFLGSLVKQIFKFFG